MTIPLIVLAALSVIGGVLLLGGWITDWLEPVVGPEEEHHELSSPPWSSTGSSSSGRAVGVAIAWMLVGQARHPAQRARARSASRPGRRAPTSTATRFNEAVFMRPGHTAHQRAGLLRRQGHRRLRRRAGRAVGGHVRCARRLQTGFVRSYALTMLAGALLAVVATLAVTLS